MVKKVLKEMEEKMKKSLDVTGRELGGLRTGRASASLVHGIQISSYGNPTPLHQLATISVPESRLLVIQPWDKSIAPDIEKAILKADLGLVPSNDGNVIRIPVPPLSEERRRELVKVAKRTAEDGRVAIRTIRREAKEVLKQAEKGGEISEDESYRTQEEIQEMTNTYIEKIDHLLKEKEKDILEI